MDDAVAISHKAGELAIDVLANDSDSDGDTLTITSVGNSARGVTPVIENGMIRYGLPADFIGTDEFTYTISDGAEEASATVSVTIRADITVSGLIGEAVSGAGTVTVTVGGQAYPARLEGNRFSAVIPDTSPDDVVSVNAQFSQTDIGKPIVLKSFAGIASKLSELAVTGKVTEKEAAGLYVSAATTSVAAAIERAAGGIPEVAGELIGASQMLPQQLIIEGAVAIKSILAGDKWETFTQQDTYGLLKDYPTGILIGESLRDQDSAKYEAYLSAIVEDENQAIPVAGYDQAELLFIQSYPELNRPGGFVVQLSGGTSGNGYLATSLMAKTDDNSVTFHLSGLETLVDTTGVYTSETFNDNREVCAPNEYGQYSATRTGKVLRKYIDSATFSAYEIVDIYSCDTTNGAFETDRSFAQVNAFTSGDIRSVTQNSFAIGTYLHKDPTVYGNSDLWQAVIVQPNSSGSVTQRFDFNSGYTDNGAITYPRERMALNMNRGDYIEYVPLGMDGVALRVRGVLKRADGSAASVGGDFIVPISSTPTLPLPSKLLLDHAIFAIGDTSSAYYEYGFGFDFLADNTGYQLFRMSGTYVRTSGFKWTQQDSYLDLRYFVDGSGNTAPPTCTEGEPDCVEWSFREFEPLAGDNGGYFMRTYQERDNSKRFGQEPGTDVWISSYIDRFSVEP